MGEDSWPDRYMTLAVLGIPFSVFAFVCVTRRFSCCRHFEIVATECEADIAGLDSTIIYCICPLPCEEESGSSVRLISPITRANENNLLRVINVEIFDATVSL